VTAPVIPFTVEPMILADIPAVVAIDHLSYSMRWPGRAYDDELQKNEFAHYFVVRTTLPHPLHPTPVEEPGGPAAAVIGIGGFWLLADEAHIGTVAIHPDWRGRGLGEWLLLHLLEAGQTLGATVATLEVRPSNRVALALYAKYGFEQVGRRIGYYDDNGEDALILTTPPLALPDYQAMLAQRLAAVSQRLANLGQNCGILGGEGRLL
jgi:ribosomal-protein-alanine N-acetyltransferase